MSKREPFQGVVTAFHGPNPDRATIDIARNYSAGRSKATIQMIMAAMRSLGLSVVSPRRWFADAASAPKPAPK